MVRVRPASARRAWRSRLVPWEGRAAPADLAILICIAVVLAVGVVARLLTPFLIANEPVLLELLTGDLVAVGAAAAFARVGDVALWAAVVGGVIGMIKFDWLTWWAGKRWGEGFIRMIATTRQARIWSERARDVRPSFVRLAVVLAMLPGVPTAVVFVIAGMSGMRLVTFLVLDAIGATAMTGLVAGLGFALGQNAVDVVLLVDRYASAVSISLIALAITVPLVKSALRRTGERRRRRTVASMSPTNFDGTIRPARPDEAAVVARIWSDGWADGHNGLVPDALYAFRTGESYLPRAADRIEKTVVAEAAGQVVGFAVVEGDEVEQVYVDAAARGTGAALALLREAERVIRDAGHAEAWLAVVEGNARARAFYERAGWRDDGPESYSAEAGDGVVEVPVRKYVRSLTAPSA